MCVRKKPFFVPFIVLLTLGLPVAGAPHKPPKTDRIKAERVSTGPAVMWNDPKDLNSRDLFYGPGGKEQSPKGTFTFVEEDREGGSPKFVVRDDAFDFAMCTRVRSFRFCGPDVHTVHSGLKRLALVPI